MDKKTRMISAINQYRSNLLNHNLCSGSTNPTSWDCDGQGNCFDPGTGSGSYSNYNTCVSLCCIGNNPPLIEGFQNSTLSNGWLIENPDGDQTWTINSSYGYNSNGSIFIPNSIYSANGEYDDLILPIMDLSTSSNIILGFDYAYSLWTNPNLAQNWSDTLIVFASSDCGLSWQNIWEKAGIDLVTTNPVYNDFEWFPSNNGDWKSESINLNNFSNQSGLVIKFRNVNQYENNLFLDNIGISADVSLSTFETNLKFIEVYPNPTDKYINVNFAGLKQIYNIIGKKLLQSYDNKIDVSALAKGVYLIRIENISIRFIKY
jgi:hypothetical protein